MAIDRIGKGPGALPSTDGAQGSAPTKSVSATNEVARPFRVDKAHAADGAHGTSGLSITGPSISGPTPLDRLRAGEVDVHGYLDLKVEAATKHLEPMPGADLAEIRRVLRDQLATDPGLTDLVRQATGQSPVPSEE